MINQIPALIRFGSILFFGFFITLFVLDISFVESQEYLASEIFTDLEILDSQINSLIYSNSSSDLNSLDFISTNSSYLEISNSYINKNSELNLLLNVEHNGYFVDEWNVIQKHCTTH